MTEAARRVRWASRLVAFLALTLLAGCGGDTRSERTIQVGTERVPVTRLQDAATALCQARNEARGDLKRANATFYDRSHDALHTLSRALEPVDRAAAARLLEDKERVEADLRDGAPSPQLVDDLDRLAGVTRSGLAALAITVRPCS